MFAKKILGLTAAALCFAGAANAQEDTIDEGVPNVDVDVQTYDEDLDADADDVDVDVDVERPEVVSEIDYALDEAERSGLIVANDAPNLITPIGTILQLGGGVMNFTRETPRDFTNPAGYWDVRTVFGSRSIVGAEAAYVGSAQAIDAVGINDDAALLSNGIEGNVRLNAPLPVGEATIIEPYAFGGIGGQFFNLINEGVNTSSIKDGDIVATVPMGVGLSAGLGGLLLDGRFTYRHTLGSELVGESLLGLENDALNQWSLGANLGFEF